MSHFQDTDEFRGATFTGADLSGTRFRDCNFTGAHLGDSWLVDVEMSGVVKNLVINDVDVTAYIEQELDRRHPIRAQVRRAVTADDYRAAWHDLGPLWITAQQRAQALSEDARQQRVAGEYSFVETLRHVVFAIDAWVGGPILDRTVPFHRIGIPADGYPPAEAVALGLEISARVPYHEALSAFRDRQTLVQGILDGLDEDEMGRECTRAPAPGYPEEVRTVGRCLRTVLNETAEHLRYADRDLTTLEAT